MIPQVYNATFDVLQLQKVEQIFHSCFDFTFFQWINSSIVEKCFWNTQITKETVILNWNKNHERYNFGIIHAEVNITELFSKEFRGKQRSYNFTTEKKQMIYPLVLTVLEACIQFFLRGVNHFAHLQLSILQNLVCSFLQGLTKL